MYCFSPSYSTPFFQAFLSDGTLAWRFYVIFNKEKWALYLPAASVILNARESIIKWVSDRVHLTD